MGPAAAPTAPTTRPLPLNVYGVTKLAGERAVLETLDERALVLRTSWVYAPWGHNFLRTMIRLLNEREQVTVVSDQTGAPTSAASAARAAWAIAQRPGLHGVMHWTDGGSTTWFEFALAIQQEASDPGAGERLLPDRAGDRRTSTPRPPGVPDTACSTARSPRRNSAARRPIGERSCARCWWSWRVGSRFSASALVPDRPGHAGPRHGRRVHRCWPSSIR